MQNIDKDQLNQSYTRLPESLKQVFDAEGTATILINIGKKYGLHIDQVGQLTTLVHYVLLGFLGQKDFNQELKNQVGVPGDIANLIVYDLNQQILIKIRKELEELSQAQDVPTKPNNSPDHQGLPSGNLREVLGPASAPQVFDEKMRGIANVPKQEVAVTPQTSDNKTMDPYREPPI